MADLVVQLIPSMLGLLLTPAAIAGSILLLSSARPFASALSFMAGFLVIYSVLIGVTVVLAMVSDPPLISRRATAVAEIVIGVVLLVVAAVTVLRRRLRRRVRKAKRTVLARLGDATPRFAFGVGLVIAAVNPNIAILLAGLAVVAGAETGHVLGAVLLLIASVSGILVPVLWRLLAPASASAHLGQVKSWIGAHDTTINLAMLLVFGAGFVAKGLNGL